MIYKLNLLLIQIIYRCNIRQQVKHPVLQIRNTYLNILITSKLYILVRYPKSEVIVLNISNSCFFRKGNLFAPSYPAPLFPIQNKCYEHYQHILNIFVLIKVLKNWTKSLKTGQVLEMHIFSFSPNTRQKILTNTNY